MFMRFISSLCGLLLWLPAAFAADSGWLHHPQNGYANVRLRGNSQQLLLEVKLQPGWKTYWRTPGEGGIAPSLRWDDPLIESEWNWPTPQRFDIAGNSSQGYQTQVSFPLTLKNIPPGRTHGTLTLSTCSTVCIITDYPFSLDFSQPADRDFSHDYAQAMGQVPLDRGLTDQLQAEYRAGEIQVKARRAAGWDRPTLFSDNPANSRTGEPVVQVDGELLTASIPVTNEKGEAAANLRGSTLSLVLADNGMAQQSMLTIGAPLMLNEAEPITLWQILLLALAGGLILNIMPCVLPVLAMKLSSVMTVERQQNRMVRAQFLTSAAGIIVAFMTLAILMTVLRLTHQTAGWGFQFQHPWFIGVMVAVTALFTANLLGLFHLRLPAAFNTRLTTSQSNSYRVCFLQGMFATLLATPCSAPFVGSAVAFALAASLPQLWTIFIALGTGMSLPWLLIAVYPVLAHHLPRPGRWMILLRLLPGLMMLGSCLWLLSLMVNHTGIFSVLLAGSIVLICLLAAFGISKARVRLLSSAAVLSFSLPHCSPVCSLMATGKKSYRTIFTGNRCLSRLFIRLCCRVSECLLMLPPTGVSPAKSISLTLSSTTGCKTPYGQQTWWHYALTGPTLHQPSSASCRIATVRQFRSIRYTAPGCLTAGCFRHY